MGESERRDGLGSVVLDNVRCGAMRVRVQVDVSFVLHVRREGWDLEVSDSRYQVCGL